LLEDFNIFFELVSLNDFEDFDLGVRVSFDDLDDM
jgi:hypothetical protein